MSVSGKKQIDPKRLITCGIIDMIRNKDPFYGRAIQSMMREFTCDPSSPPFTLRVKPGGMIPRYVINLGAVTDRWESAVNKDEFWEWMQGFLIGIVNEAKLQGLLDDCVETGKVPRFRSSNPEQTKESELEKLVRLWPHLPTGVRDGILEIAMAVDTRRRL